MKTLNDADVKGKVVLLRVDFNVSIEGGRVAEDFRMRAVLPTIEYLLENGARKVVLASHLGRPDGMPDPKLSLQPVAGHLSELLGRIVDFVPDAIGSGAKQKIEQSGNRIVLLENLRFYKGEEANNEIFARNLAALADIFVQEAFGACHRKHASVVGIPQFIPSYAGLLVEEEVRALSRLIVSPERLFTVLIGGAKISTKIAVLEKFLAIADHVCLGGALANTVLKARGLAVGLSLVEDEVLNKIKNVQFTSPHMHLPTDVKVAKDFYARDGYVIKAVGNVASDEIILDIGPDTQGMFAKIISGSKTVLWNGPMGYIENKQFAEGTERVAAEVAQTTPRAFTVVGGGDTYKTLQDLHLMGSIDFISTGGGAMLDFLAEGTLPGIEALR